MSADGQKIEICLYCAYCAAAKGKSAPPRYGVSGRVRSDAGRGAMRNKIINIILVLCVLAGVGILVYPFVSNMLHDRKQDEIITEYDEQMENLAEDEKA